MTTTIDFVDAGLAAVLDRTPAGEDIILAQAGRPYARLVKLDGLVAHQPGGKSDVEDGVSSNDGSPTRPRRQPGGWPELANIPDSVWFDPLPDDELDAWEGKYSNIF